MLMTERDRLEAEIRSLADKLGRLSALTGTRGYELADFFDGSPHSGVMDFFNSRMIAEFSTKTGIKVAGSTLAQQAQEAIREALDPLAPGALIACRCADDTPGKPLAAASGRPGIPR